MKALLPVAFLLLLTACERNEPAAAPDPLATPAPVEYADWYVVNAPVDRQIEGVWGDVDGTLLISTMFTIYRSTDRGRSWQEVHKKKLGMFSVVEYRDTLFTMTLLANQTAICDPSDFSVDDGKTWQEYKVDNPALELPNTPGDFRFYINPVTATNGETYRINRVFRDPQATVGDFTTPGIITGKGRRIDLPKLHQLRSLYLDTNGRLYITGTDAICGQTPNFAFCNSRGGRGVVYVSKRPMP